MKSKYCSVCLQDQIPDPDGNCPDCGVSLQIKIKTKSDEWYEDEWSESDWGEDINFENKGLI